MAELNIVDTDPSGNEGQIVTPYLQTLVPGYSFGMGNGYLEFGSGTPGSLPFRVDQAGNVTAASVSASVVGLAPSADATGAKDTAAIAALLALGVTKVQLQPGVFYIGAQLATSYAVWIQGSGPLVTTLKIVSGFTAASVFSVGADGCKISDLGIVGPTSTVAGNPAANGIELSGYQHCRFTDLWFQYVNGYVIECVGGSSSANLDTMISDIVGRNCAGGIHLKGVSGSSYHGEHFLTDIQLQQMGAATGTNANLDALLIEDIEDILGGGVNIGMVAGAGECLHIKGACATVQLNRVDIGSANTVILIEDSSNGSPTDIHLTTGIAQQAATGYGLSVTGGAYKVHFSDFRFTNNYLSGASLAGTGAGITLADCEFDNNNQAGGANYDLVSSQSAIFDVRGCNFNTPIASATPGSVPQAVNDTAHQGVFTSCAFTGSGIAPSTAFSGIPQIVRSSRGYNPRGSITAPTIGASPASVSTSQNDVLIIFTAINGMTAMSIGGTSVGLPTVNTPYFIPARQTLVITWATTVPTWQWIAN